MNPAVKILGKVSISAEGVWDRNKEYERLCLVYREVDNYSFLSKKSVPKGTDLSNTEYWQKVSVGGYKDNNIIVISDIDPSTGEVVRHTLESAINIITPVDRTPGLIISFYGVIDASYNTLDWYLYQFKSNNIDEWFNIDNWVRINTSNNDIKVIDNLTSTNSKVALSANMGRVLANMISSITGFSTSIVTDLPSEGQSGIIYFVKNDSSTETRNVYTEYVWLDSLGVYEELGEFTTAVDLSDYQEKLVSGSNIKTVFGNSILGVGNIAMPIASNTDYGGVKLGYVATGDNVPVLKDVNGKLYVTIPKQEFTKSFIIELLEYTPANVVDLNKLTTTVDNLSNRVDNINISSLSVISSLKTTTTPGAPGVFFTNNNTAITVSSNAKDLGYSTNNPFGKIIVPHGTVINFTGENMYTMLDYKTLRDVSADGKDIYHLVFDPNTESLFIELVVYGNIKDVITYGSWSIKCSPTTTGTYDNPLRFNYATYFSLTATRTKYVNGVASGTESISSVGNANLFDFSVIGYDEFSSYFRYYRDDDGYVVVEYANSSMGSSNIRFSVNLTYKNDRNVKATWWCLSV